MKLEQSFEVDAPLERVWEALVDVERVAPCLPGAVVTGRNDDGTYNGTFTIKIGPTTASYAGKLEMQNIDEAAHSATMHAHGSDKRGQGGATATIVSTLSAADGTTRVEVVTDYHITGRLARFGRGGMIEDISERLLREFAGRLQSSLAGGGGGGSLAAGQPTVVHGVVADAEAMTAPGAAEPAEAPAPAPEEAAPPPTEVAAPEPEAPAETPAPTELAPPPDPVPAPEPEQTASEAVAVPEAPEPPAAPEIPEPPPPAPPEPPEAPEPTPLPPVEPPEAPEPPPPPPPAAAAPPPPPPPPPRPPAEPNEPLDAGSLVGGVLVERVKRNPKPVIAVAGGLLLLKLIRRRR